MNENEKRKSIKYPKLRYIESMHEQREMHKKIIPLKGDWVELGKFTPVVESFDTIERYECIEHECNDQGDTITITLKQLDLNRMVNNVSKISKKIVDKHGELISASLCKAFLKIARNNKYQIAKFKAMLKTKTLEEFKKKRDELNNLEYLDKLKLQIEKREKNLDKLKKKAKFLKNNLGGDKDEKRNNK